MEGIKFRGRAERCLSWVKTGKAQCEHMTSALPLIADIAQRGRHVRFVPNSDVNPSVDYRIGASNQGRWYFETERLRGLEVDR